MLALVHFLHLLAGIAWAGGGLVLGLAFYPALARLDQPRAAAIWEALAPPLGAVMGAAAGLTMLLGLVRAWLGGGIIAFADLVAPYGLIILAALLLALLDGGLGGAARARLARTLATPEAYAAGGRAACRNAALASTLPVAAIIVLMTMLGLGLY